MRTAIESLTEDEFLRDLVRFPFQSRFATCSCIGTWILRTFTDMLIFLLKLPLLFKSPSRHRLRIYRRCPRRRNWYRRGRVSDIFLLFFLSSSLYIFLFETTLLRRDDRLKCVRDRLLIDDRSSSTIHIRRWTLERRMIRARESNKSLFVFREQSAYFIFSDDRFETERKRD